MPLYTNAGLNFYVGSFVAVGPAQQAVVVACLTGHPWAVMILLLLGLVGSVLAPLKGPWFVARGLPVLVRGYYLRCVFTLGAGFFLFLGYRTDLPLWLLVAGYGLMYFGVVFLHKTVFNIGWLYLIRAAMPVEDKTVYIARVRRINALTSMGFAVLTIVIIAFAYEQLAVYVILISGIVYSAWSSSFIHYTLRSDPAFSEQVAATLPDSGVTLSFRQLIKPLFESRNAAWLIPSVIPTVLAPPLLLLYLTQYLALDLYRSLAAILLGQAVATLFLPRLMSRIEQHGFYRCALGSVTCVILAIVILFALPHIERPVLFREALIALVNILCSAAVQLMAVVAHVRLLDEDQTDQAATYARYSAYNLVLDLCPIIWLAFGSLVISQNDSVADFAFFTIDRYGLVLLAAALLSLIIISAYRQKVEPDG